MLTTLATTNMILTGLTTTAGGVFVTAMMILLLIAGAIILNHSIELLSRFLLHHVSRMTLGRGASDDFWQLMMLFRPFICRACRLLESLFHLASVSITASCGCGCYPEVISSSWLDDLYDGMMVLVRHHHA